jgi:hypothetical protein
MVDINKLLPLARMAVYGFVSFLSLIVLALSCHIVYLMNQSGFVLSFGALCLATAALTLISLPPLYLISLQRKGAVVTYIVVEVAWLWFLWIMWIASAGSVAEVWLYGTSGAIAEVHVVEAFSFLNWLALMFYTTALFIVAIVAHLRGSPGVWTSSVAEFDFNSALNKVAAPGMFVGTPQPYGMQQQPMQQQFSGYAGQPTGGMPHAPQV